MEEPPRHPLEVFPKEVWEMIILKVKDSEDLRNFMKASKQLDDMFMEIRHMWLLDKVLPILTTATPTGKKKPYLGAKEVKKLRLVDKRWCGAVNTFLENQPNLRPYNKDDDKLNSEKHIWSGRSYQDDFWDSTTLGRVVLDNHGGQLFRSGKTFVRSDPALEEFGKSDSNPFPARSVVRFRNLGEPAKIWVALDQDVSQKISNHVWFLTMAMAWGDEDDGVCYTFRCEPGLVWEWIVHSLTSLPNLKGLNLEIMHRHKVVMDLMPDPIAKKFLKLRKNKLPPLPSLESLKIINFEMYPILFSQKLVSKYSLQLRRLQISIRVWETRKKCKLAFPSLTDLCLQDIGTSEAATQVLKSLEAPQLAKLRLLAQRRCFAGIKTLFQRNTFSISNFIIKLEMEKDIFPWIALFPSLLHLDISSRDFSIIENGTLQPPQDTKPSLKYLKIRNSHEVNYNFLRCLPSLQRLQVSVDERPIVWDCSAYPEVRIKLEMETNSLYQSNVWDLCPKLRSVSMFRHFSNYYKEFDRATYEKLKNTPGTERVKLRRGIRGVLRLSSDSDSEEDSESEDEEDHETDEDDLEINEDDDDDDWETEEEDDEDDDDGMPIPMALMRLLMGALSDEDSEEDLEGEPDVSEDDEEDEEYADLPELKDEDGEAEEDDEEYADLPELKDEDEETEEDDEEYADLPALKDKEDEDEDLPALI